MPFWFSLLLRWSHPLFLVLKQWNMCYPEKKKKGQIVEYALEAWIHEGRGVTLWLWIMLQLNSWTQQKGNIDCNTIIRCNIVWDSNKSSISTCTSKAISDYVKRQNQKKKNIGFAILYKTSKQLFFFFFMGTSKQVPNKKEHR